MSQLSWDQPRKALGESSSPACAHEAQRVSPLPRAVFVRPIGGRLEELTHECLTTFGHSADALVLSVDTVPSFAVPSVDSPPVLSIEYRDRVEERVPPPYGVHVGELGVFIGRVARNPSTFAMAGRDPTGIPRGTKLCWKPKLVGREKILRPVRINGRDYILPGGQPNQVPPFRASSRPPLGVMGFGVGRVSTIVCTPWWPL